LRYYDDYPNQHIPKAIPHIFHLTDDAPIVSVRPVNIEVDGSRSSRRRQGEARSLAVDMVAASESGSDCELRNATKGADHDDRQNEGAR
jgi:hypothetical protein